MIPKQTIKETPKYAFISPEDTKAKVIARDRHYEKLASGVVRDTRSEVGTYISL